MTGNAFAAIDLDDTVRHDLAAALHAASTGRRMPGKLVPPENWHLTVRFLGDIEDEVVDRFAHAYEEALDAAPSHVTCAGLGAFPSLATARVLYADVGDTDQVLPLLATQAETAAERIGLEPEGRPYRPHLTLSRLRPKQDVQAFVRAFGDFSVRIPVDAVTIFRSERTAGGLRYRVMHRLPIA